jgi:hypothetical protein
MLLEKLAQHLWLAFGPRLAFHTDIPNRDLLKLSLQMKVVGATPWMISQDSQGDAPLLPQHITSARFTGGIYDPSFSRASQSFIIYVKNQHHM